MWRVGSPTPENQILVVRGGAVREAGRQDADEALREEAAYNIPGGRFATNDQVVAPRAAQISELDPVADAVGVGAQISDVVAIDVVAAQNVGRQPMGEAARDLAK